MKRKRIERLAWIPSWALSLVAALLAAATISFLRDYIEVPNIYIIWSLLLAIASFLICIIHPTHVWLVAFLCNILSLLPAACDDTFWTSSFGIIIGSGLVLSVITAHLGALLRNHLERLNHLN
jgi:uncharacterized membrane protein YfhO